MKNFLKLFKSDLKITDNSPLAERRARIENLQDADALENMKAKFEVAKEFAEKNYKGFGGKEIFLGS